ncbi:hypothetical protein ILYODFUR_024070 [Ilyodon furcidens]|uniref:Immunoglobulin domain-containing protein n=1 Tax=Ilyodon furcidens TaxID=33524 RepID=A0ABV0TQC8_9TELE
MRTKTIEACDVARYGGAGVPSWSQAWGRDSLESALWLGCSSWDPSPYERCEVLSRTSLQEDTSVVVRKTCEGDNLFIKTSDNTIESGRYRMKYIKEASRTYSVLSVSISGLTPSDSGLYRCGLGESLSSATYQDVRLVVVDALLDGNKDHHLYKEPGGSLTVACSFKSSGRKRLFCRGGCGTDEVLIQTDGVRAERGRYRIEYDAGPTSEGVLLVTITQLTQSDSGRYQCKMDRTILKDLYRDFIVTVTDAADPSTFTPTITQNLRSSSESFTSSVSSETSSLNQEILPASDSPFSHNVVLMVLTLTITLILLSVALLAFCRTTSGEAQTAPAVETEKTPATEVATIYENVSEDYEMWRSVDEVIYAAYSETVNTRPTGAEEDEDSSSETIDAPQL